MEDRQRVTRGVVGGGWAKRVRGIKKSMPEIIVALYENQLGCKLKKKNNKPAPLSLYPRAF